ncbi:sugar phosphate isomerase/epimerase family protein [Cohaesibacter celericrescens]|uniref:Endonuclease n=1 Tax=Cohaesibacter celericrescens TaxID=2067669 RepID=A0A2N5XQ51_9HYPH|nr:sugar phosphate isomerase/epimerase family protein [Cohaesibacter celericrescens]PLW76567.1 endonuclease [Cohaesibacter celericrescens]
MKLGLGSYAFRWSIGIKDRIPVKPMTAFDVLDEADNYGLGVVQYADNMPLDQLSESEHYRLFEQAQEKGIALELGTQSFHAEEIDRYLIIGKRLNTKILRVALDAADALVPVADLVEQMRPLLETARQANIRIAIENHFNFPSPRMVELLEAVNDETLGVCLDVANSICAGEWPEETIRLLAPYTINFHLKDYVIIPDNYGVGFDISGVPLGQGRAPIPWILDQLAHCDPDMSVLLEHWLPYNLAAQEREWLDQTVAAAKQILGGQ